MTAIVKLFDTNAIVKPRKPFDVDQYILAMWLLYGSRPRNPEPESDGSYFIGDVREARLQEQRLLRDTPYSPCRGRR
jgi:hypothetical protein